MITQKAADDFRVRLISLIKQDGRTASEIARAIDESPQLLRKWLCCNVLSRLPAANYVLKLADCFGVNARWLISGEGPIKNVNVLDKNAIEVPTVRIHVANSREKAEEIVARCHLPEEVLEGPDHEILNNFHCMESLDNPVMYSKDYLCSLKANPEACERTQVCGDSMSPLIQDGDYVLIDSSDNRLENITDNSIYIFSYKGVLFVRRLIRQLTKVVMQAENPKYSSDEISSEEAKEELYIFGRVLERTGPL